MTGPHDDGTIGQGADDPIEDGGRNRRVPRRIVVERTVQLYELDAGAHLTRDLDERVALLDHGLVECGRRKLSRTPSEALAVRIRGVGRRSEEHTSELQSR